MQRLPIDDVLPEVVEHLRSRRTLVLEAPPGAGKTTRVPRALLDAGLLESGELWVLQPRRLAARLAARRVAQELGESPGETVGWQVRFEDVSSPRTRIRFVTEGLLTRRLLSDPTLQGVAGVLLDEFHERHLHGDTGLALLRRLQLNERPDLLLGVMSATLEADPVATWLGNAPRVRSEGRRFDVTIEHLERPDDRPLAAQVASALRRLVSDGFDGDVLVFLPGAADIRRAQEACASIAESTNLEVVPLHGELSPEAQDRAIRPGNRRKVILSTNVAETSVTIEGVVAVIDSGLARIAGHSPWTGLPTLAVSPISKASAVQRAGRAGRLREGRCLRLFTRYDFDTRRQTEVPEIRRLDLAQLLLELRAANIDPRRLDWFEAPDPKSVDAGELLLRRLGALDDHGSITEVGRRMLRFPVHPRLARVIVEAAHHGVAKDGAVLAAIIGERDIRSRQSLDGSPWSQTAAAVSADSDPLELLDAFRRAQRDGFAPDACRRQGLEPSAVRSLNRARQQLERLVDQRRGEPVDSSDEDRESLLLQSLLHGFPDRVAKRRSRDRATSGRGPATRSGASDEVLLFGGGTATLSPSSVVRNAEMLIAIDAEERKGHGTRSGVLIRSASAVEPEWLLDLPAGELTDVTSLRWNPTQERVEATSELRYGALVLEESILERPTSPEASQMLLEQAQAAGIGAFADAGAVERLQARIEFIASSFPETGITPLTDSDVNDTLAEMCDGRTSFAELREASLTDHLLIRLGPHLERLDALAPEHISLAGGRRLRVHYEAGKPPWVESRLQDFFGTEKGPVLGNRVPLVLHLLAPNQRAVQVTTDLSGFWDRHYPSLRRELMRRYPRHSWPDDPRTAQPPAPGGRGRNRP